ncbi:uncharacterized protein [Ptychodera flava]|uniref:uncharacterized protein n=1 Tax=Ptychodera flava TaxID=63121 RepID=UPI00396A65A6
MALTEGRIMPSVFLLFAVLSAVCPLTTETTPTPRPEGTTAAAEPEGEPSPEPTAEAESGGNGDSEPEDNVVEAEPSVAEILIPSFSGMLLFVGGAGLAIGITELRKKQRKRDNARAKWARNNDAFDDDSKLKKPKHEFLSDDDIRAIDHLQDMFNRPVPLLQLVLPTVIALLFAPALLFLYNPLSKIFWPSFEHPPEINKAIASFLAPSGFVYAISFGFSLQGALQKQVSIEKTLTAEVSLLDQIMILVMHMSTPLTSEKLEVLRIVKDEAISIILQVQGQQAPGTKDFKSATASGQVWKILPMLKSATEAQKEWSVDRVLVPKVIDHMMKINTSSLGRHNLIGEKMHPVRWVFLEMLSFTAFFGVMLIDARSYRLELTFCIMTVFSISALCYIVADLDSPYSGFFRVNVTPLTDIVAKAEQIYKIEVETARGKEGGGDPSQRAKTAKLVMEDPLESSHPCSVQDYA